MGPRAARLAATLACSATLAAVAGPGATVTAGCSGDTMSRGMEAMPDLAEPPPVDMAEGPDLAMLPPCLRPDNQECGPYGCPARDGCNWCNCTGMGARYTCSQMECTDGGGGAVQCKRNADCGAMGVCVFTPGCNLVSGFCVGFTDNCNFAGLQYCTCDGMTAFTDQSCGPSGPFKSFGPCM